VSYAVRPRGDVETDVPLDLRRMIRASDIDYRLNVQGELRRRRGFIGPAEMRRLKGRIARKRLARARQSLAAKAAA